MKEEEIGHIAIVTSGNSAPQDSKFFENGSFPFVRTGDIGKVHRSKSYKHPADYLNEEGIKGLRLFPKGSILLPKSGASTLLNHRAILGEDSYVVSHLAVIIPNEDIVSSLYLYYATTAIDAGNIVDDRAYPSIKTSAIAKLRIPLPPLSEQERIVSELDLLTEIIDKQKAQLKELDTLAQSIFYDMFGDPVLNDKGWEKKKLGEVCDVRDGTHDSPEYHKAGYPLITSKNIIQDTISFDNVNYISKEDYLNISKRSKVDDGDIIMPMIGTIGNPIVVRKDRDFAIKNVALIKFFPASKINNIFVKSTLQCKSYDDYMRRKNKGGTQKFIALGDIRNLEIPLPPLSLQQSFADKVSAIEQQKAAIGRSIAETQQLFDYTMDKYFG